MSDPSETKGAKNADPPPAAEKPHPKGSSAQLNSSTQATTTPEAAPAVPEATGVQSAWLKDISAWIAARNALREPSDELKQIGEEGTKSIAELLDDFHSVMDEIGGSGDEDGDVALSEQDLADIEEALDEAREEINDEIEGFEAVMKDAKTREAAFMDLISLYSLVKYLVRLAKTRAPAAKKDDELGSAGSTGNPLQPALAWAKGVIAAKPSPVLSEEGAEMLTTEQKAEFAALTRDQKLVAISTVAAAAVILIPTVCNRGMAQDEQQQQLAVCSGIPSLAAALTIQAGMPASDALYLLELGRGIIASLQYGLREDLTLLKTHHPELAADFERWRDVLDRPPDVKKPMKRLADSQELEKVIKKIRASEGFEGFLLPPSAEDLAAIAWKGPIIVVNVAFRCDAILVQPDARLDGPCEACTKMTAPSDPRRTKTCGGNGCKAVVVQTCKIGFAHLKDLKKADISRYLETLKSAESVHGDGGLEGIFEWLWTKLAKQVLDELNLKAHLSPRGWPRVWWVLTGSLSLFPVHAAGEHRSFTPGSTVMDRVVSSYSPTVKALLHAPKVKSLEPELPLRVPAKVVLAHTGANDIPHSKKEINDLMGILAAHQLKELASRPRQEILNSMADCKIFHFAGHAESDALDPSKSHLVVGDGPDKAPITVLDVEQLKLHRQPPFLAYLSACETAKSQDVSLMDESIHLMGAFQLAGFQHVIGSLWKLLDDGSPDVACGVYTFMKSPASDEDDTVAHALHDTLLRIRDNNTRVVKPVVDVVQPVFNYNSGNTGLECRMSVIPDLPRMEVRHFAPQARREIGKLKVWGAYIHMGI